MTEDREKIVARITKLLSLATSDNVNEAEEAASKAQELLIKYNVEQNELDEHIETKTEKVIEIRTPGKAGYNKIAWYSTLAWIVGRANLCEVITSGSGLIWVGRPTNIEIAQYIFENLVTDLTKICEAEWESAHYTELLLKRVGKIYQLTHGKTWKNSFYHGANQSIRARLNANLTQLKAEPKVNDMVVANDVDIDEYKKVHYPHLSSSTYSLNKARSGFEAGKAAGQGVSFRTGIGAGGSSGTRLLGGG